MDVYLPGWPPQRCTSCVRPTIMTVPPREEDAQSNVPATLTFCNPVGAATAKVSPTLRFSLAAQVRVMLTSLRAAGGCPLTVVDALNGWPGSPMSSVGAPPVCTALPCTMAAPVVSYVPAALATPGSPRTCASTPALSAGGLAAASVAEARLGRNHHRRALHGRVEDTGEAVVDLVGKHVGAGDHGHAQQDGQGRKNRAQRAAGEAAYAEADHREVLSPAIVAGMLAQASAGRSSRCLMVS